jgi:hypothetical protein
MHRIATRFLAPVVVSCFFVFLAVAPLRAQNSPSGHWQHDPDGVATDGFIYDLPPAGFDPVTATDAELEQYGLPPRPPINDVTRYARWKTLVTATRVPPRLEFTKSHHGPVQGLNQTSGGATSENWSGYVVDGSANPPFTGSNSQVYAQWVIPTVTQGICSGTFSWVVQWVGLDGFGQSDVLQAGSQEIVQNCKPNELDYATWYEWYPAGSTNIFIGGDRVNPSDYLEITVWYTTTSPHGHAYLLDGTTGKASSVGFNGGAADYKGATAEWIVERPEDDGNLTNLADYGTQAFFDAQANDALGGTYYLNYEEATYPVTDVPLSMVCPPWSPSSTCPSTTIISQVGPVTDFNNFTTTAEYPAAP